MPCDLSAIGPLDLDEIINEDEDDENWADPRMPSDRRSRPGDGKDNDNGKREEDTHGCEKGTAKGKGTNDGKPKRKVTEDRNGKGNEKSMEEGMGKVKGNGYGNGIGK